MYPRTVSISCFTSNVFMVQMGMGKVNITDTCLYDYDSLKPHFNIVKLGFTGVYIIFHISAQKHRL